MRYKMEETKTDRHKRKMYREVDEDKFCIFLALSHHLYADEL